MVTEDLKRLRKALDEALEMCDRVEELPRPLREALERASSLTDDISTDIRRIESDISAIYRML